MAEILKASEELQKISKKIQKKVAEQQELLIQAETDIAYFQATIFPRNHTRRRSMPCCVVDNLIFWLSHNDSGKLERFYKAYEIKKDNLITDHLRHQFLQKDSNNTKIMLSKYLPLYMEFIYASDEEAEELIKPIKETIIANCPFKETCPHHNALKTSHTHGWKGDLEELEDIDNS